MTISKALQENFEELADLWESSARASHFFLNDKDITLLKKDILNLYFPSSSLSLYIYRDQSERISGFIGVAEDKVEMLFIAPECFGKGIGKILLSHATQEMGARKVDVNEDNPNALAFYLRMGFEITGRSPQDGQGRDYPLLHMQLKE